MSKLRWIFILLTCLTLAGGFSLSAYGGGGGGYASNVTQQCDEELCTIDMVNLSYTPDTLIVHPFAKITWINKDDAPHTVTSITSQMTDPMNSELLKKDESYTITLEEAGEYKYFCQAHPRMMGTIIVKGEPVPELPEIALYIAIAGTFASMIAITRFRKNQFKQSLY